MTSEIERMKAKGWRMIPGTDIAVFNARARFISHDTAIDVCLASWPIDRQTVYRFTMTPPVIPETEENTP